MEGEEEKKDVGKGKKLMEKGEGAPISGGGRKKIELERKEGQKEGGKERERFRERERERKEREKNYFLLVHRSEKFWLRQSSVRLRNQ